MPHAAALSIIVQGPVLTRPTVDGITTAQVLASLRRHFPAAEIILSTWQGSPTDGLDADAVVLSADPGSLRPAAMAGDRDYGCNVNRMLVSTAAGLARASRPRSLRTRTDVVFTHGALADFVGGPAMPALELTARIGVVSCGTKDQRCWGMPFHPADMVQIGATQDLRALWAAPRARAEDYYLPVRTLARHRLFPEQYIFTSFLLGRGIDAVVEWPRDTGRHLADVSLATMLGAFDVFDQDAGGVALPPRILGLVPAWQCHDASGFASLRAAYQAAPQAVAGQFHAAILARIALLAEYTGRHHALGRLHKQDS